MRDPEIGALRGGLLESIAIIDQRFKELARVLDDPRRLQAVNRVLRNMTEEQIVRFDRIVRDAQIRSGIRWVALILLENEIAEVVASRERIASGRRSQQYCQVVVATEKPWTVPDTRSNGMVSGWKSTIDLDIGAYAGVPVFADGECVGALCMFQSEPRDWNQDDIDLLKTFAKQVDDLLARV